MVALNRSQLDTLRCAMQFPKLHWSLSFGASKSQRFKSQHLQDLGEAKPGGFQTGGGFPLFSGKVLIVSWTLSGLFLAGAVNRPRKRKRANRENPRRVPGQIGKIPEKSGKSQQGKKRDKKDRRIFGRLCGGFCAWLADFGGFVRRWIFCFRLADFPADFFGGFFFCVLRPKKSTAKIHRKIHHFHGGLLADFPP